MESFQPIHDPRPAYDLREISHLESQWQALKPNFHRVDAFAPSEITTTMVDKIAASLVEQRVIDDIEARRESPDFEIEGIGHMRQIGQGELKRGFVFETSKGKRLAILVHRYYSRPPTVTSDPHIYGLDVTRDMRGPEFNREYGTYSAARTYVSFPVDDGRKNFNYSVHIQEYLGDASLKGIPRILQDILIHKGLSSARRYIKRQGFVVAHEDWKEENFLFPGEGYKLPVPIDVEVSRPLITPPKKHFWK